MDEECVMRDYEHPPALHPAQRAAYASGAPPCQPGAAAPPPTAAATLPAVPPMTTSTWARLRACVLRRACVSSVEVSGLGPVLRLPCSCARPHHTPFFCSCARGRVEVWGVGQLL